MLTPQEKWRVPIIFNKVNKGENLSAQDKRIWNIFIIDKSEEELWSYIMLHRSNRKASLPENCPFPPYSGSPGKLKVSRSLSGEIDGQLPPIERTPSRTFSFDSRSSSCPSIDCGSTPNQSPRQKSHIRRNTTSKLASASDEGAYSTCPGKSADERTASGQTSTLLLSRRHSVDSTSVSPAPVRPFVPPSLRSLIGWSSSHSLIGSKKVVPTTALDVDVGDK